MNRIKCFVKVVVVAMACSTLLMVGCATGLECATDKECGQTESCQTGLCQAKSAVTNKSAMTSKSDCTSKTTCTKKHNHHPIAKKTSALRGEDNSSSRERERDHNPLWCLENNPGCGVCNFSDKGIDTSQ